MTIQLKEICPQCKMNRTALKEMLAESPVPTHIEQGGFAGSIIHRVAPMETENHYLARILIGNCPLCSQEIKQ